MKDEINDLRMESGSIVCSEAGTGVELGSGTFSRPPPLISRCNVQEGWRSKDGLQIIQKVVFKGIIDDEVLMLVSDLEKMVPRRAHKWSDWDQTRKEQGPWPTKTMVSVWFINETNLVTMIELLKVVKEDLEKASYKIHGQTVKARLEFFKALTEMKVK